MASKAEKLADVREVLRTLEEFIKNDLSDYEGINKSAVQLIDEALELYKNMMTSGES